MIIFRFLGLILMISSLMLLGADGITTLEMDGVITTRSLDEILTLLGASPRDWLETTLPGAVTGAVSVPFDLPGWMSTGVLGLLFALMGGRGDQSHRAFRHSNDYGRETTKRRPHLSRYSDAPRRINDPTDD